MKSRSWGPKEGVLECPNIAELKRWNTHHTGIVNQQIKGNKAQLISKSAHGNDIEEIKRRGSE